MNSVTPADAKSSTSPPAHAPFAALHRKLSSFGVLLLTLSCLSPVYSIFGIGPDVLQHAGTGAAAMFLGGIAVAVVWAVVYAELAAAYPYAGGDYVGVGSILGPWAGVVSLTVWAVTLAPATAFIAKSVAIYVADLAPGLLPRLLPGLSPRLSPVVITFAALGAAVVIALLSVRTSALVTGIFLALEMVAVLALVAAGFWHPARSIAGVLVHPVVLGANGALGPVTLGAMALAGVSAAYATCGGNQAVAFGEELIDPHRHMGRVILAAGLIGAAATALPVIAVVLGARDLPAILASPAPISAFFSSVAGTAAGRLMSGGVALAIFNALIAQVMFFARLFFSLGRDEIFHRRVNVWLARVHGASGAPRTATLVIGALSAACCLLDAHLLIVFSSGLVVYTLALVSYAVLLGRRRGSTGQPGHWRSPWFPLAPILGLCLAAAFAVADLVDADAGRPSMILLGVLIAAALGWHHWVLQRRVGGWTPRLG